MHKIFVDTDVILDLFIKREPHHASSLQFFSLVKRKSITMLTSPLAIANAYYILAKAKDKSYALNKMKQLRQLLNIGHVDETTIDKALQVPGKDFEDSIQYYCAVYQGVKFIVTRNERDFPKKKIEIVNPVEYMNLIAAKHKE